MLIVKITPWLTNCQSRASFRTRTPGNGAELGAWSPAQPFWEDGLKGTLNKRWWVTSSGTEPEAIQGRYKENLKGEIVIVKRA